MRDDLPTGTVTFLFTDVEGSTRLLEEIGDEAYEEALSVHRQIVRAACERHDGVEVDTQGDAFFFAFPEPSGALAAAQQMTEGLGAGPIQVRIGLHTGTPRLGEEGYVGSDVHFGARVAASAHGGQVVLSQATRELVDGDVLTDLGEHRLKDIEHAVAIFQLGDGVFPPLKTISNTNLPRPASSFVGRERELNEVRALIEEGARLVTLIGPGGSGKTRLALETASTVVPEYKAGVFWIGLSALRDPALVTETISQTLGAKDGLVDHISEREMLLLLDNLEQVIESAPDLSGLLAACPNLTLLVTSRELLRVQGEVEYPVPPLASPEAVALFSQRSSLEPSEDIAELCARLDNLPLAVELAAARTKALSPKQILERLSQRLDLLMGGRDADPRQQTLRATIEWSYDLLSEDEQRVFAALSVFAGGCTLEAAEEVADANLDSLQSLVEKSLLRFTNERYWMLETIREYALDELDASGGAPEVHRRHASWYLELSEQSAEEWLGAKAHVWVSRLEREIENVRKAVQWGLANDVLVALSLVANTWVFWIQTGRSLEERRLLEAAWTDGAPVHVRKRALRALTGVTLALNDTDAAMAASEQRLELARATGDLEQQAAATNMLATVAYSTGDSIAARQWFEEAIHLSRTIGDVLPLSTALGNYGRFEREAANLATSRELLEECLAIGRKCGSDIDVAWAVKELAMTAIEEGSLDEARRLVHEGFELVSLSGLTVTAADLVFAVAMLCSRTARAREGALLFGAYVAMNEREGFEVSPTLSWWWSFRAELVAALGESDFQALLAEGSALDQDAAVRYAQECVDQPLAASG